MATYILTGLGTLTTDHAASSHGIPVLVVDGQAYGPADQTPGPAEMPWLTESAGKSTLCALYRMHKSGELGCTPKVYAENDVDEYGDPCEGQPEVPAVHTDYCRELTAAVDAFRAPIA